MEPEKASARSPLSFSVNGETRRATAPPMSRLLDVLRDELGLTGTKEGCGEGECGSCAVLMDGVLVTSCLVPVLEAAGTNITTIEGITHDEQWREVQAAFLECGGAQCGICTPGMILATVELLRKNALPTDEEIREGLAGNLCRCTGYLHILKAVAEAARRKTAR
jgi:aerobic carbon-monoxide dehydrogenase small subunit